MIESRLNRRRQADVDTAMESPPADPSPGSAAILCQTTTVGTYPVTSPAYYAVLRVTPGGTETEGSAPSLTSAATPFYAASVGMVVPPVNSYVVVTLVGPRWVFQYNG